MNQRPHPTVTVVVGNRCAEIDEELAPFIEQLWNADIETVMSCQEAHPEIAWIEFDSPDDLLRFLDLVVWYEEGPNTMYARAHWMRYAPIPEGSWDYQFNLMDIFEDQVEQTTDGCVCFHATVGLSLPKSDISELTARLLAISAGSNSSRTISANE